MARPLKKDYTKDIVVHYYMGEELKEGKLLKQVGYNKYIVVEGDAEKGTLPFIVRLVAKEVAEKEKECGMGYVVVTHTEDGEKSLAKLTKNLIVCSDGSVYPFEYELDTSVEGVVKVLPKKGASVALEGFGEVVVEEPKEEDKDDSTTDSNNGQASITIEGGSAEGFEE